MPTELPPEKEAAIIGLRTLADQLEANDVLEVECAWRRDINRSIESKGSDTSNLGQKSVIVLQVKLNGIESNPIPIDEIALLMGFNI